MTKTTVTPMSVTQT